MASADAILVARSLVKVFGGVSVVNGIHFSVKNGECVGIVGPNGSGKSTLLRMLYGALEVSAGEAFVDGVSVKSDMRSVKKKLGVVPQNYGLDPSFTVFENLVIFGAFYGLSARDVQKRFDVLVSELHLDSIKHSDVSTLSDYNLKKVSLARALIHDPQILIVDEPSVGLDATHKIKLWSHLDRIKNSGRTILLSSHTVEEAERICDRVIILNKGKVLAEGNPKGLIEEHVGSEVVEFSVLPVDEREVINFLTKEYDYQRLLHTIRVYLKEGQDGKNLANLISGDSLLLRKPTLDDVFLKLSGAELV